MTWVHTTLSFRAAVDLGAPELAGRMVRVEHTGGAVWCGSRMLGPVRSPADCRVGGGLPAGLARDLRRRRRARVARLVDRVTWAATIAGDVGVLERGGARIPAFEHQAVRVVVTHEGGALGVVLRPWPIVRDLVVAGVGAWVRRRKGARRLEVREARLEIEDVRAGDDGFYEATWSTIAAWCPPPAGWSTRCGCVDDQPRATVGAGASLRVSMVAERPRGFRPSVELGVYLRHRLAPAGCEGGT